MAKVTNVADFLKSLAHARKVEIEEMRAAILKADPKIGEQVKWNAPSFIWNGDDRVTMRLHPGDRIELIFHRGAKPKRDPDFTFSDPTGFIEWVTHDRGVLKIPDQKFLKANKSKIAKVALAWMCATS
jgi:hypothetical protein